ncbi:MAG: hypothetical protein RL648_742 [Verrucomicrobiota bacterium]
MLAGYGPCRIAAMKKNAGFSVVELLVVLGVMSLVMGMVIPAVGMVREKAQRMATGHKLRQVALAVATYQATTGRALSGSDLAGWLEELARESGALPAELFLFEEDPLMAARGQLPPTLLERGSNGRWSVVSDFAAWPVGVAVVSGVGPGCDPARTPILWTRGLEANGRWRAFGQDRAGIYGDAGGFVAFLDGHVEYYRDLSENGGQLIQFQSGQRTGKIVEALPPGAKVFDYRGGVF